MCFILVKIPRLHRQMTQKRANELLYFMHHLNVSNNMYMNLSTSFLISWIKLIALLKMFIDNYFFFYFIKKKEEEEEEEA